MARSKDFTRSVNLDDFAQDITRVEDLSDRVRLAAYGLAAPLVAARAAQMRREVERTAKRKGKGHPEVALRQANAARAEARFALFREELDRARIPRPEFDEEKGAAIWGRVVDEGVPEAGLSVSALSDGRPLDFDCTEELGSFALKLPATTPLVLSVRNKEGTELYRDPEPTELGVGEQRYREIDLTRGAEIPCPEPAPDVPPEETSIVDEAKDSGQTPERLRIDRDVAQLAEMVQKDLIEREVLPADEPSGAFAQRLEKAGVRTIADVDELLTMKRGETRKLLGLRTLEQTDQATRALKRGRKQVGR